MHGDAPAAVRGTGMGAAASPLSRGGSGQRHTHECIPHRAARVDDGVLLARGVGGRRREFTRLVACGSTSSRPGRFGSYRAAREGQPAVGRDDVLPQATNRVNSLLRPPTPRASRTPSSTRAARCGIQFGGVFL